MKRLNGEIVPIEEVGERLNGEIVFVACRALSTSCELCSKDFPESQLEKGLDGRISCGACADGRLIECANCGDAYGEGELVQTVDAKVVCGACRSVRLVDCVECGHDFLEPENDGRGAEIVRDALEPLAKRRRM